MSNYQYRLRNFPEELLKQVKNEQKKMNEKSGYFHSLERVIYKLIKKGLKKDK